METTGRSVARGSRRQQGAEVNLPLGISPSPSWEPAMHPVTPISPSGLRASLLPTSALCQQQKQQQHKQQQHSNNRHSKEGSQLKRDPSVSNDATKICFGMDVSAIAPNDDSNGNRSDIDSSGISSQANSQHLHPSHRVQHPFVPRHSDEIALDVGDPISVDYQSHDHWSQGTNLRTNQSGIFPTMCVFEVDIYEDLGLGGQDHMTTKVYERDIFYLTFLGAVEVAHHKGNDVLMQAINKVLNSYQNKDEIVVPSPMILEISYHGIHMIQKSRKNMFNCPNFDYFYTLQNISFCGAHPKQFRYFGFITKHPLLPRFACHVFMSNESTQPIVESVGRAFKRSYDEYMAFAHPTEDIFID